MKILGTGRLQHHWWGSYCATIVLRFQHVDQDALARTFPSFVADPARPGVWKFHGGGAALKMAEAELRAAGTNMKKVASLKVSIDVGEPFTVTYDTTPEPTEVQAPLLLEDRRR